MTAASNTPSRLPRSCATGAAARAGQEDSEVWRMLRELHDSLLHSDISSDSMDQLDRIRDAIIAAREALARRDETRKEG